jgi:O-antigen ligase
VQNLKDHKKKNINRNPVGVMLLGSGATTLIIQTSFYDPFNTPKFIVLMVVASWLLGHLANTYRKNIRSLHIQSYKLELLVGLFIIFLFISSILTDIKFTSFFGESQRKNGMLTYLALSIILLYASHSMTLDNSKNLIKIATVTGFIMCTYGLIQVSGNDFIAWNNPYNSMISTLGNPNFASAMLAIFSSVATLTLFLKSFSRFYKLFALATVVMSMLAIIRSDSRQGLITYLISVVFFLAVYLRLTKKRIAVTVGGISIVVLTLAVLGMLQRGPFENLVYKESVSVRGFYWRAGLEMFKNSPFFGVGVDRYGAFFKEFREVSYPLRYGYEITSSNAHNTIIQFFATSGLFVGISYLSLLAYILIISIKLLYNSNQEEQKIVLLLLSSWIGFQAQSFISIDNIGVSIWGWLFAGTLLGINRNKEKTKLGESISRDRQHQKNVVVINLFQPFISLIATVVTLIGVYFIITSETDTLRARNLTNPSASQNTPFVKEISEKILDNPFSDPNYKINTIVFMFQMGLKNEANYELDLLLRSDPRNLDFLQTAAAYQSYFGDVSSAIKSREVISLYDPYNALNYLALGELYLKSGDIESANRMQKRIISFAPKSTELKKLNELLMES